MNAKQEVRVCFLFLTSSETLSDIILVVDGYLTTLVALCGMILNIAGLRSLLSGKRHENWFNLLLSALLIFDTMFCLFSFMISVETNLISIPNSLSYVYNLIAYPGSKCFLISSIGMTVLLTESRHRAVCQPVLISNSLNSNNSRKNRLIKYVTPVLLSSILLTIPCLWEFTLRYSGDSPNGTNIMPSTLRQNIYYSIFYIGALDIGICGLPPLILLAYYTKSISMALNRNTLQVQNVTGSKSNIVMIYNRKKAKTTVVKLISVFFLGFHSLRLALSMAEFTVQIYAKNNNITVNDIGCNAKYWLSLLSPVSQLFLVLNSSVNTIIYHGVFKANKTRHISPGPTQNASFKLSQRVRRQDEQMLPEDTDKLDCESNINVCEEEGGDTSIRHSQRRKSSQRGERITIQVTKTKHICHTQSKHSFVIVKCENEFL